METVNNANEGAGEGHNKSFRYAVKLLLHNYRHDYSVRLHGTLHSYRLNSYSIRLHCKGVRCPPIFSLSNLITGTNRKAYLLHASFALRDSHCQ